MDEAAVVAPGHRASIRAGDLAWVGSHALATADLATAARAAVDAVGRVLATEGLSLADLVRLGVYYDQALADDDVRTAVRDALPVSARPVLTLLPVREPALPGAPVVIDGAAAVGARRAHGEGPFATAVEVDGRIWIGGTRGKGGGLLDQTRNVIDRLTAAVTAAGGVRDDCVKMNIAYIGTGTADDWKPTARFRGDAFAEPAAAATGIPFPRLPDGSLTQMETLSVAGSTGRRRHGWPEGHWDWPIHLPWKHACRAGDLVTVGGQVSLRGLGEVVDPGDLGRQTETALRNIERALATVDARLAHVTQLTAFYEGSPADLATITAHIAAGFDGPPPPLVPVPLPFLAYRDMVVEIEAIAVVRPR